MTKVKGIRAMLVVKSSVSASARYSCAGSPDRLAKDGTTMEKRWAASGRGAFDEEGAVAFVATTAGRCARNKYHAPAAIPMNKTAIPGASRASAERFFRSGSFACAGTPTCSE